MVRLPKPRPIPKLSTGGCIILPIAAFAALMIATAGVALWPKLAQPGAALLCGGGEIVHQSFEYSRPGEYSVSRVIYCQAAGGAKGTAREEITFGAMGLSFLVYTLCLFLLLQFAVRPLLRRRVERKLSEIGISGNPFSTMRDTSGNALDVEEVYAR